MVRENVIKNKPEIVEITPATQLSVREEFPVVQATDSSNAKIVIKKGDICISVNSEISPQLLSAVISSLTNALIMQPGFLIFTFVQVTPIIREVTF